MNDNVSDNKSSASKVEKNIAPFYKNINYELFQLIAGENKEQFLKKTEGTVKVKELLTYGKISGVIGEI